MTKRLLPIASAPGPRPKLSVEEKEWQRLERILGKVLSPATRKEVIEATNRFLSFAVFDLASEPIDEATNSLNALTRAGKAFFRVLVETGQAGGRSDGPVHALHLIRENFVDGRIPNEDMLTALTDIMASFVAACEKAQEMHHDCSARRRGDAWDTWIRNLTEIFNRNGLPTAARKDAGKNRSGRASKFVAFVEQLQKSFDERFRRGTHSTGALTEAIARARRVTKEPMSEKNKTRKKEN
jgi:hypothetical protein